MFAVGEFVADKTVGFIRGGEDAIVFLDLAVEFAGGLGGTLPGPAVGAVARAVLFVFLRFGVEEVDGFAVEGTRILFELINVGDGGDEFMDTAFLSDILVV